MKKKANPTQKQLIENIHKRYKPAEMYCYEEVFQQDFMRPVPLSKNHELMFEEWLFFYIRLLNHIVINRSAKHWKKKKKEEINKDNLTDAIKHYFIDVISPQLKKGTNPKWDAYTDKGLHNILMGEYNNYYPNADYSKEPERICVTPPRYLRKFMNQIKKDIEHSTSQVNTTNFGNPYYHFALAIYKLFQGGAMYSSMQLGNDLREIIEEEKLTIPDKKFLKLMRRYKKNQKDFPLSEFFNRIGSQILPMNLALALSHIEDMRKAQIQEFRGLLPDPMNTSIPQYIFDASKREVEYRQRLSEAKLKRKEILPDGFVYTDELNWENGPKNPLVKVDEYTAWYSTGRSYCKKENEAMEHCASDAPNYTLISLRTYFPEYKAWKVHLTASWDKEESLIGQMKGPKNAKPSKKYHPAIIKLLNSKYVWFSQPFDSNDFSLDDLSRDNVSKLKEGFNDYGYYFKNLSKEDRLKYLQKRFGNDSEKLYEKHGVVFVYENYPLDFVNKIRAENRDSTLRTIKDYMDFVEGPHELSTEMTDEDGEVFELISSKFRINTDAMDEDELEEFKEAINETVWRAYEQAYTRAVYEDMYSQLIDFIQTAGLEVWVTGISNKFYEENKDKKNSSELFYYNRKYYPLEKAPKNLVDVKVVAVISLSNLDLHGEMYLEHIDARENDGINWSGMGYMINITNPMVDYGLADHFFDFRENPNLEDGQFFGVNMDSFTSDPNLWESPEDQDYYDAFQSTEFFFEGKYKK